MYWNVKMPKAAKLMKNHPWAIICSLGSQGMEEECMGSNQVN